MSKLIYSPTSTLVEGTYDGIKNRDQAVNPVYYSVAFTGDGYMYTHGRKFRLFTVTNDEVEGLFFQVQNGVAGFYIDGASVGTGNVIQSITNDGIITTSTTDGVTTVGHSTFLTQQQAISYGSATQIPIITVNESGHITAIQNSGTIDVSKIRADATTTTGYYHPVGVTDNTLQNPLYHNSLFFDESGNVYATNYYIGANPLSDIFAPISHISVYATDSTYGHVMLSDTPSNDDDVTQHIAATPKAVTAGVAAANQYSQDLFAAQDAMVFVGTIEADGTITAHNTTVLPTAEDGVTNLTYLNYKVGWTFRFVEAGTFNGEDVEVGDMLIAVHAKGSEFDIEDWTVIQTNISGALTSTSNLNGILYANSSRVVNSLPFSAGILKYNGTNLEFVNPNTTWRDIKVDSVSIGTNNLNLISGNAITLSESNGDVTIGVNASNIIQTSAALTLEQDLVSFMYKPTAAANLTIGSGLTLEQDENSAYILRHASGTAFTNKLGSITTDSYGHVTGITEVSTLPNPYNLTIKTNNDNAIQYDGSTAKVLIFKDGGDISFTTSTDLNSNQVIQAEVAHKYRSVQFYPNLTSSEPVSLLANSVSTILTLIGGTNVSLSNTNLLGEPLPDGTLMISAEDTWRNILAYRFTSNLFAQSSIDASAPLKFSDDFLWSNEELGITWTEIDEDGRVTYVK